MTPHIAGLFVAAYDAVARMQQLAARYGQFDSAVAALAGEAGRVDSVAEEIGLGAVREVLMCVAQDLAAVGVSSDRDRPRLLGRAYHLGLIVGGPSISGQCTSRSSGTEMVPHDTHR